MVGNQVLPWSRLREGKPKRGEESGVGGDRALSDLVFVECRDRKIEGAGRATPGRFFFFFFFSFFSFFLYHAFIVFRYKKLRAALAMEKTKPINQKPNIKNQLALSSTILNNRQNNRLSLTNQ